MTTEPKETLESKGTFNKSPTIIETTYEKVLSIINKVKDFIKKTSTTSKNLIEDLEWVIKVITNKSLYTYELKQDKVSKQNAEYNKFISFVTKYNEEVIEMNKKHDIVSGILSIGKKGEILLKPSLCLNKILPDELKNLDEKSIREKRLRQNNFINVFGNTILKLYNNEMEKRKKSVEYSESTDKANYNSLSNNEEAKSNNINIINSNESNTNKNDNNINNVKQFNAIKNSKKEEKKVENEPKVEIIKNKQKSENTLEKDNRNNTINFKKYNTDENFKSDIFNDQKYRQSSTNTDQKNYNINIQKIKVTKEKGKLSDSKFKFKTNNLAQKKNYKSVTKLTKQEKITFNNIKKAMRNYYIKFAYNDEKIPNMEIYELKGNFINNKSLYKTNFDTNKKYKTNNIDRSLMTYKNFKYSPFPHNFINIHTINNKRKNISNLYNQKSEDIFKNYKIVKSLKDNLIFESKENKFENIIYETNNNMNNKFQISKRYQITSEKKHDNLSERDNKKNNHEINTINNNINDEKKEKMNTFINNRNKNQENKEENTNSRITIKSLYEKYFTDIQSVTDIDFHIFKFKEKVGYKKVLPIMGYAILKTMGLIDSKIISTRKLDSFLTTVSDNYKETTLYHNALHGADVTQSLFVYFLNSNAEEICETTVLDLLGMFISAMGHDLGHPGLNNNYHINASSDLAITYNDASCLENFHTSYLFKILRREENNIFERFSVQNYKSIRKRMISQILATDMANHGETISLLRSKIKSWKEEGGSRFNLLSGNEKTKFDEQQVLLNYLIHMADLGHNCKKFEISVIWIRILCEEFWQQGDKEKAKGLPISFMCDRDKIDVPASQVGFLRGFILSSFDCLVSMFPKLKYNIENAQNNIKRWKKLQDEKHLLGWTPKKEKNENENKNKNEEENEDKKENKIKEENENNENN